MSVIGGLSFLAFLVHARRRTGLWVKIPRRRDEWARLPVHPELRVSDSGAGRLVIGTTGRSSLAIGSLESLLAVGPAHAGKASGLAIPALLEWSGPAVVASARQHLMDETIGWRSHQGDVHVFDPAGASRYYRSGWSLLSDCQTWQGAIRTAQHLTAVAQGLPGPRVDGDGTGEIRRNELWSSAMAMSLAPFLHAAAAAGRPVTDAAQWIEREERDQVLDILRPIDRAAAYAHETTFFRDDPSRSSFFHLMFQVLSVYGDPTVAATAAKDEIVPAELLDGGCHTLYLTAPEHDQARFQPLFATIVRQVLTAVYDRFAAEGTPLDPPLLVVFDEAVGVASVEDLAAIASTAAAKGVQVVSVFHDLGRSDGPHANAGELLARSHRAMLVLGGERGGPAAAPSSERPRWADLGARLPSGEAALLYTDAKPVRLRLRRWYHDAELSRRVKTEQDSIAPSERRLRTANRSPLEIAPTLSAARQTNDWRSGSRHRRGSADRPRR